MRAKGWLYLATLPLLLGALALSALLGWQFARWQAGLTDFLCADDFREYQTEVALRDDAGIELPAGTRLRVRFCEYNAQAQLEVLIEKSEFDRLRLLPNPSRERWLYNLRPTSEDER